MPLDPSIISGLKQPQFESPTNALMNLLQVSSAQRQNQLMDFNLGEKEREADDTRKMNRIYQMAVEADGKVNRNKLLSEAATSGLGSHIPKLQKGFVDLDNGQADVDKKRAEAQKAAQEAAEHQYEMAGQLASAWAKNPGVTQKDIRSGLAAAAHIQVIKPEIYQAKLAELDGLPDDPRSLNQWATGTLMQVMKSKDSMGFIRPDANTVANNERIVSEGKLDRENRIKVQQMAGARQDAKGKGNADASLDNDTLDMMADQALRGDRSVFQNVGRGAQGSANLVALRGRITQKAKAQGITGADLASITADFSGLTAGLRTSSNISARIENAAEEASQLAPLAVEAGRQVARSGFLPFGKAQVMFDTNANDPALNKFATANMGLATAYANAMARGQKATVHDMQEARELLSKAKSQQAYEAIVTQMQQEIAAAQRAPQQVRENLRGQINGKGGHGAQSTQPTKASPTLPAKNSRGWTLMRDAQGNQAYVSPDGKQHEEVH